MSECLHKTIIPTNIFMSEITKTFKITISAYQSEKGSAVVAARARANAGPSEGGDVPEKYYVVQNNEVIRVKYLLVYGQKTSTHRYTGPLGSLLTFCFKIASQVTCMLK